MLKVKFKLIISEIEINEEYVGRKRNDEENIIEKEFDINESEDIVLYEGLKNDEDIIERMEIAYKLNEKEKMFKQRHGKNMTVYCEKEELDITDSELNYEDNDNDMEAVNEILQEESSNNESETSINGESSVKRKRKRKIEKEVDDTEKSNERKKARIEGEELTEEEEISEDETEEFKELLKDLCTPVTEEQIVEPEDVENMTLERLFIRAEKGSQELVKYWYDVGKEFRNEIRKMKSETNKKEKAIRSDIYNRMEKNLKG
ncbi:unnamed protein product [Rhizophagus irregularis]|nr:unnamed protein product [Rhizophagus irregularis]